MIAAFPRKQWLRERASMLRLYVHCLSCLFVHPHGRPMPDALCHIHMHLQPSAVLQYIHVHMSHVVYIRTHLYDTHSNTARAHVDRAAVWEGFDFSYLLLVHLTQNSVFYDWTWTDWTRMELSSALTPRFVHQSQWKVVLWFGSESVFAAERCEMFEVATKEGAGSAMGLVWRWIATGWDITVTEVDCSGVMITGMSSDMWRVFLKCPLFNCTNNWYVRSLRAY
jgi:hypothetical protein